MKKILKILIYPISFTIGQFIINYLFVYLFNKHQLRLLSNAYPLLSHKQLVNKLNHLISTSQYKIELMNYLNSKSLIIILTTSIIFIPLFMQIYKKYQIKHKKKINNSNLILISLLGISISLIFNLVFSSINFYLPFTNTFELSTLPINIQILSSGILGPVMEELLFRGIVYNKIKKIYKPMKSIVLASFIFALFHLSNPLNILYAFMMSFVFIYLYEKFKSLWAPILMHVVANTTTIIAMFIIVQNIIWLNILVAIIMIIVLIVVHKLMIKKDLN